MGISCIRIQVPGLGCGRLRNAFHGNGVAESQTYGFLPRRGRLKSTRPSRRRRVMVRLEVLTVRRVPDTSSGINSSQTGRRLRTAPVRRPRDRALSTANCGRIV